MTTTTTDTSDAPGGTSQRVRTLAIIDENACELTAVTSFFRSLKYRTRGFSGIRPLIDSLDWSPDIDCIVTDVRLGDASGDHLVSDLRSAGIVAPIVLVARQADMALAVRGLKAGASEIVEKPLDLANLAAVVQSSVDRESLDRNSRSQLRRAHQSLSRLTERQREIVELIVLGMTSKQIGLQLGISYRTVEAHRLRIMERLEAHSLQELIRLKVITDLTVN
jgi:two-component system response regulator FixJ